MRLVLAHAAASSLCRVESTSLLLTSLLSLLAVLSIACEIAVVLVEQQLGRSRYYLSSPTVLGFFVVLLSEIGLVLCLTMRIRSRCKGRDTHGYPEGPYASVMDKMMTW